jgi:uncharacterized protein
MGWFEFILPLIFVLIGELLFGSGAWFPPIFYVCVIAVFVFVAARNETTRAFWSVLIIPVLLRIMNTSLPFPILTSDMQIIIIYTLVIGTSFFVSYNFLDLNSLKFGSSKKITLFMILAVIIGILAGITEHSILGETKLVLSGNFLIFGVSMFMIGFGEEFVYRGCLQRASYAVFNELSIGRLRMSGAWLGILFTSLLFGLMHLIWGSGPEFVFTFFAGLVFGILYYITDNLWVPITAHITNNIVWLVFM